VWVKSPPSSLLLGYLAVLKSKAQARNQLNNILIRGNNLLNLRHSLFRF
jgi:hypothetical protein